MLSALLGQDLFSNFIDMLLDMDAPESLLDRAAVLGLHIEPRQLRLDPQGLPG